MPSFPLRQTRSAIGPKLSNARPVTNPETQPGADSMNAVFWGTAGAGITCPLAWALVENDGAGNYVVTAEGKAWDPDGTSAPLNYVSPSPGAYDFTFPSSAPDELGDAQPIELKACAPIPQGLNGAGHFSDVDITKYSATHWRVKLYDRNTSSMANGPVLILWW